MASFKAAPLMWDHPSLTVAVPLQPPKKSSGFASNLVAHLNVVPSKDADGLQLSLPDRSRRLADGLLLLGPFYRLSRQEITKQLQRIGAQRARNCYEFNHVNPALAALVFGDK